MFRRVKNIIEESDATKDIKANIESPESGFIYFRLVTDNTFEEQLKHFQPENSALVVENGDIVEFDVRLGQWSVDNREQTMEKIKKAVAKSRRRHYVPPLQVDCGGSHGFVPHIRIYKSRVVEEEFVKFLESLTSELQRVKHLREL